MAFSNLVRWHAEELHARMARGEEIFVIDVRSRDDRTEDPEAVPSAHWVPLADLIQYTTQLPRNVTIVTYCA